MNLPCSKLEWKGRLEEEWFGRGLSEIGLRHSMFAIPLGIQAELLGMLLDVQLWSPETRPWLET